MSTALTQEVRFAVAYKQQPDLMTPLTAADMWSLRQTNTDFIQAQPVNEDDATDLGKGVYITQTFPSHIQAGGNWNGRLTSESAAMISCFGIGAATSAVAGAGTAYTMIAPDLSLTGLMLPSTTMVIQIRTGVNAITDKALVGMCCEEFGFDFRLGPGRDNAQFSSAWIGTGSFLKPSAIVMPTIYQEHSINAGGITTLKWDGTASTPPGVLFDYIQNLRFISATFRWKNNLRDNSSYYPGSGSQNGYQLRGRMRRAAPTITLTTQVECDSGSSEEDMLLNQTPGVFSLMAPSASVDNSWGITFYKVVPRATPIQDADGIASYNVDWTVMQDPTNGVLQIVATCLQTGILTVGP